MIVFTPRFAAAAENPEDYESFGLKKLKNPFAKNQVKWLKIQAIFNTKFTIFEWIIYNTS